MEGGYPRYSQTGVFLLVGFPPARYINSEVSGYNLGYRPWGITPPTPKMGGIVPGWSCGV